MLHTSTESILTRAGMSGPIDENVEIRLSDAVGPYCRSKLLAERYAFLLAGQGLPVVVANPTMPVGPGDRNLSPPSRLVLDFCRGKLPAAIDCTLNLIDVRDVAHALVLVMRSGRPMRRYILGAHELDSVRALLDLERAFRARVPRFQVPYALALAFAYASERWADHVSGLPPQATVTGVRLARRIMHFDTSQTEQELGFRPRPVRESLGDLISWLVQTGLLRCHVRNPGS